MRTAFLLCLAGTVAAIFKALVAATAGEWEVFVPWVALALSTLAHGFVALGRHLMEQQRREWRRHAETQLRAIFTPHGGHQRQEREEALREWRS